MELPSSGYELALAFLFSSLSFSHLCSRLPHLSLHKHTWEWASMGVCRCCPPRVCVSHRSTFTIFFYPSPPHFVETESPSVLQESPGLTVSIPHPAATGLRVCRLASSGVQPRSSYLHVAFHSEPSPQPLSLNLQGLLRYWVHRLVPVYPSAPRLKFYPLHVYCPTPCPAYWKCIKKEKRFLQEASCPTSA